MAAGSEYLKIEEAARLLRVSTRTVYRRIWSGELPANKVGGLYYIKRADLESLLAQGRLPSALEEIEAARETELIKCGNCFRLITSDAQVGAACSEEGCEKVLCSACVQSGIVQCLQHQPDPSQLAARMQERLARGELLVPANIARLRELNFLNRIHERLARIGSLIHPLTGEVINVPAWDEVVEPSDERAEVMRLLGKVFLDSDTLSQYPLNAALHFHIPQQKRQKGAPVEILVQVLSRIEVMLRDGCDGQPLQLADLSPWIIRLSDEAQRAKVVKLVVLAANTGWAEEARQAISGQETGEGKRSTASAFMHRSVLFYLFDLEKGDLIYNFRDERARQYAELFAPALPAEELREVEAAIQKQLVNYDTLSLAYACEILPFPPALLKQAFERLAAGGEYRLVEVPQIGTALIRK